MACVRCGNEFGYQVAINTKELKLFYNKKLDELLYDTKGIKVHGTVDEDKTINGYQLLCEKCIKHFNNHGYQVLPEPGTPLRFLLLFHHNSWGNSSVLMLSGHRLQNIFRLPQLRVCPLLTFAAVIWA